MNDRATLNGDFIRTEASAGGIQRLAARFRGHAYDPHRHETYAVGMTLSGAQAFRYRGLGRVSRQGQSMVLHPDELHDGHSDAPDGFEYLMVYVEPEMLAAASGSAGPLPFVQEAVRHDEALSTLLTEAFVDFPSPLEPMERDAWLCRLADILHHRGDAPVPARRRHLAAGPLARVAGHLREAYAQAVDSADLEKIAGLDRYDIARQFRRWSGTSPHRYLVGRRLEAAQRHILAGEPLSDIAARTGFADQSHMTRHFKARYGMTPGRFAALVAAQPAS